MSKRRSKKEKEEKKREVEEKESRKESKRTSGRATSGRRVSRKSSFDMDQWINERLDDLSSYLQINYLGLDRELMRAIVKRIIEILWDEDKKPDMERLSSRIRRNLDKLRSIISQMILESGVELSSEQFEYVASSDGPWILSYAPTLYRYALKYGREDLLSNLRYLWVKWWTQSRDSEIPPECPRCGFNALMPDGVCIVCGYSPAPTDLLKHYRFDDYIDKLVSRGDINRIKTILTRGLVLVSSLGIKSPDEDKSKYDLEVHLPRIYREKLQKIIEQVSR